MWGGKHFYFGDNITVGVRDLDLAIRWYQEKLGLHRSDGYAGDDVDALLLLSKNDDIGLGLLVLGPDFSPNDLQGHPILYSSKIEAAHEDFVGSEVNVGPIQKDSGGNRFFRFQDLDGNTIEVCVEPGTRSRSLLVLAV
jgi:catechol 2,3-dioxygenase-like lactoylglutathione lyase family enzyme